MRKNLVVHADGSKEWVEVGYGYGSSKPKNVQGEDLTVDGYINKYGGIESAIDGSVHTSKQSYNDHLKANDCTIKDW